MTNGTNLKPIPFRTNGVKQGDSNDVTGAVFYAYPGTYNTTTLQKVQFFVVLTTEDDVGAEVAIGAQFSDDGVNWPTDSSNLGIYAEYNCGGSWIKLDGRTDVDTLSYLPGGFEQRNDGTTHTNLAHLRLFVRFGVFVRNQSSSSTPRGGTVVVGVVPRRVEGGTAAGGPVLCPSGGTTVGIKTPVTPTMRAEDIEKFRATINIESNTGVELTLFRFESDDGVTWDTVTKMEATPTVYADPGIVYGSAFVDMYGSITKAFVRFGVEAKNVDGEDDEYNSAVVGLRMDWRSP